jgi:hypothetical protein
VICEAAKKIGATVICANMSQAHLVAREHGVKTMSLGQKDQRVGTTIPYLWDHFTSELMEDQISATTQEISRLRAENSKLQRSLKILTILLKPNNEI